MITIRHVQAFALRVSATYTAKTKAISEVWQDFFLLLLVVLCCCIKMEVLQMDFEINSLLSLLSSSRLQIGWIKVQPKIFLAVNASLPSASVWWFQPSTVNTYEGRSLYNFWRVFLTAAHTIKKPGAFRPDRANILKSSIYHSCHAVFNAVTKCQCTWEMFFRSSLTFNHLRIAT